MVVNCVVNKFGLKRKATPASMETPRLILVLLLLSNLTPIAIASKSFRVHRAVQFDLDGSQFGSRVSTLELKARSNPGITIPKLSKDGKKKRKLPPLNRQCVVVTMKEATKELIEHLVDARRVGGLLVIIPAEDAADAEEQDATTLKNWRALETWITSRELKVPIYFTVESEHTPHLVDLASSTGMQSGGADYLLKASVGPSKKISSSIVQNVQGWVGGEYLYNFYTLFIYSIGFGNLVFWIPSNIYYYSMV